MRISYLFDRPLPANETDSEQVVHTVAALARAGAQVRLLLPMRAGGRCNGVSWSNCSPMVERSASTLGNGHWRERRS